MPTNKLFARAVTFARRINDASLTDAERDTASNAFAAHCDKHNIDAAAAIAAAATAEPAKRQPLTPTQAAAVAAATAPKPAAKPAKPAASAKPEKPSKPASGTPNADAYAERVKLIGSLRDLVNGVYDGPSLAVRSNPKRFPTSVYSDLLASPKHRTILAKLTLRDESALFLIIKRGERNGSFDPVALNLDAGLFSRLASVGFIAADGPGAFILTPDALAHARGVAKRAA